MLHEGSLPGALGNPDKSWKHQVSQAELPKCCTSPPSGSIISVSNIEKNCNCCRLQFVFPGSSSDFSPEAHQKLYHPHAPEKTLHTELIRLQKRLVSLSHQLDPNHLPAPPENHVNTVPEDATHPLRKRALGQLSHSQERISGSRMGLCSAPLPGPTPVITTSLRKPVLQPHSWECCRTCVAMINYSAQTTAIIIRCFKNKTAIPV